MTVDLEVAGAAAALASTSPNPRHTWRAGLLAGLAALTLVAAIGAVLAPVVADDPVVHWPQAGQQPRSTLLPLVPYRPLRLDAQVPCAALAALSQRPDGGDALRTLPVTADQGGHVSQGLVVAVHGGVVQVSASGRTLVRELLPSQTCIYRVLADAGGVRVLRSQGAGVPQVDGLTRSATSVPVPQVNELVTDLEGQPAAAHLAVTLHPDSRYESSPAALKSVLLAICASAGAALYGLTSLAFRSEGWA